MLTQGPCSDDLHTGLPRDDVQNAFFEKKGLCFL